MTRFVIECSQCGQNLSVPKKTGELDCPKCANTITLKFEPRVVYTPPWFNKKFGFILIFLALWLWADSLPWLQTNLPTLPVHISDVVEGIANFLCFAGVMVVALADLVRNRGRLFGEQAYLTPASKGQEHTDGHEHTETEQPQVVPIIAPKLGRNFYIALLAPLIMVPVSLFIPEAFNLCVTEWFVTCNEIGRGGMSLLMLLPFGVSLMIMAIGSKPSNKNNNEILVGARISGVLTFVFFLMLMFVIYTVSPV